MRSIEAFYQANMESTKKANNGYKSVSLLPGNERHAYLDLYNIMGCLIN